MDMTRSGPVRAQSEPLIGPAAGGPVRTGSSRAAVLISETGPVDEKLGADRRSSRSRRRSVIAMWAQDVGEVVGEAAWWPEREKTYLMMARRREGEAQEIGGGGGG